MDEMSREEFERLKNSATEKMRELNNRQTNLPPFPDFVRVPNKTGEALPAREEPKAVETKPPLMQKKMSGRLGGFLNNINLSEMLKDKDSWLILGLIFLLSNEEADESLIMALAYILL